MSGDPDAVWLLATRMTNLAGDVNTMRDKFTARYLGGIWEGEAFEAFATTLEDVPKDLEKVGTSYTMASRALHRFSTALGDVQRTARDLARQSTDAESRVNAAEGERTRARREVKLAKSAVLGAPDPLAKQDAQRRLQRASTALGAADQQHGQATSDLNGVRSSANTAVDAFKAEVKLCCQRLHDASEAGIQNTLLSAYNRHIADTPLGILIEMMPVVVAAKFMARLVSGDLEAWSQFLDGVGIAVGIAAITLLVVGTGGAALVVLAAVGVGAAIGKYYVDSQRVQRGEISKDALIWDGVGLGVALIPGGGAVARFAPASVKAFKALTAGNRGVSKRFLKYGPTYRSLTKQQRIDGVRRRAVLDAEPARRRRGLGPLIRRQNTEPCVAPTAGITASPAGVFRHVRPIVPRPIALAHAA